MNAPIAPWPLCDHCGQGAHPWSRFAVEYFGEIVLRRRTCVCSCGCGERYADVKVPTRGAPQHVPVGS